MDQTPSVLPSYITALLRTFGGVLGGWLIAKGYLTADNAPQLGGAALVFLAFVWSMYQKYVAHKRLANAIAAPAGDAGG